MSPGQLDDVVCDRVTCGGLVEHRLREKAVRRAGVSEASDSGERVQEADRIGALPAREGSGGERGLRADADAGPPDRGQTLGSERERAGSVRPEAEVEDLAPAVLRADRTPGPTDRRDPDAVVGSAAEGSDRVVDDKRLDNELELLGEPAPEELEVLRPVGARQAEGRGAEVACARARGLERRGGRPDDFVEGMVGRGRIVDVGAAGRSDADDHAVVARDERDRLRVAPVDAEQQIVRLRHR